MPTRPARCAWLALTLALGVSPLAAKDQLQVRDVLQSRDELQARDALRHKDTLSEEDRLKARGDRIKVRDVLREDLNQTPAKGAAKGMEKGAAKNPVKGAP